MTDALPFPPEVRTVERWCVVVVRSDGTTIEILPRLFSTQQEATLEARYSSKELRGMTVSTARCTIEIPGEGAA